MTVINQIYKSKL